MINQISSANFINKFNSTGGNLLVEDFIIQGKVVFNSSNYLCPGAKISNCHFTEGVVFEKYPSDQVHISHYINSI